MPKLVSRYRYAAAPRVQRVLKDFRELFLAQGDLAEVKSCVVRLRGTLLSLSVPSDWYLLVNPFQHTAAYRDADARRCVEGVGDLLCCADRLEPLGQCVRWTETGECDPMPIVMFMGSCCNIWAVNLSDGVLHLVAPDIDSLARRGLLHFEPIYQLRLAPRGTVYPRDVVRALLDAAPPEGTSVPRDGHPALIETVRKHRLRCVALSTPGEGEHAFCLCGFSDMLRQQLPFIDMSHDTFWLLMESITYRLDRRWWLLGTVGEALATGLFRVDVAVILGQDGAIYGFDHKEMSVFRLADSLQMFFACGLLKWYAAGTRFDTPARDLQRLEHPPLCVHVGDRRWGCCQTSGAHDGGQYETAFDWLSRPNRFRDSFLGYERRLDATGVPSEPADPGLCPRAGRAASLIREPRTPLVAPCRGFGDSRCDGEARVVIPVSRRHGWVLSRPFDIPDATTTASQDECDEADDPPRPVPTPRGSRGTGSSRCTPPGRQEAPITSPRSPDALPDASRLPHLLSQARFRPPPPLRRRPSARIFGDSASRASSSSTFADSSPESQRRNGDASHDEVVRRLNFDDDDGDDASLGSSLGNPSAYVSLLNDDGDAESADGSARARRVRINGADGGKRSPARAVMMRRLRRRDANGNLLTEAGGGRTADGESTCSDSDDSSPTDTVIHLVEHHSPASSKPRPPDSPSRGVPHDTDAVHGDGPDPLTGYDVGGVVGKTEEGSRGNGRAPVKVDTAVQVDMRTWCPDSVLRAPHKPPRKHQN
ncbi:gp144 [Caviid betaherpesvirus 2]|uniref:Gp144 n=1 Tax=Guinea pig cytomegalovirus (strain 22122) TaxID=103920 RepID=B7TQ24_GPCMV|nr:gp144 [Caviid betaherpesvirus 2]AGE11598.1 gp144 [Caviid betaherpesvirus 2]AIL83983.1 gp144 [BAC cloning vector GPN13BACdenovo_preserved(MM)]BAJ78583.1 gp144 [Caviid betaherpesvirus 2]